MLLLGVPWDSLVPQPNTLFSCSNLRPGLKPLLKSQILQTCLHSVYRLPATESLKSDLSSLTQAPDVNSLPATEPLKSDLSSSKQAPDVNRLPATEPMKSGLPSSKQVPDVMVMP